MTRPAVQCPLMIAGPGSGDGRGLVFCFCANLKIVECDCDGRDVSPSAPSFRRLPERQTGRTDSIDSSPGTHGLRNAIPN